ncbi:hypothetical protein LTR66_015137, partial [Elasticomyces elasticus]
NFSKPRYSEDMADRNFLDGRQGQYTARDAVPAAQSSGAGLSQPLSMRQGRYSEDVADWNIVKSSRPTSSDAVPSPLMVKKKDVPETLASGQRPPAAMTANNMMQQYDPSANTLPTRARDTSISRKQVGSTSTKYSDALNYPNPIENRSSNQRASMDRIKRTSPDKPLPVPPQPEHATASTDIVNFEDVPTTIATDKSEWIAKDAAAPLSLKGIVDLTNSEDTTVHERWAPGIQSIHTAREPFSKAKAYRNLLTIHPVVTHETVQRHHHHIITEEITREIHTHDVYHRILPIIDIEVLPARHFVPTNDGYVEISADEVPGRTRDKVDWVIAEMVSKRLPSSSQPIGPRRFTARTWLGNEGDDKAYIAPEGHPVTETTWVHPPQMEDLGRASGQTLPFYLDSPDPRDDGLHARLPAGVVIGKSPLLVRQQQQQVQLQQGRQPAAMTQRAVGGGGGGAVAPSSAALPPAAIASSSTPTRLPPPVPLHKDFTGLVDQSSGLSGHHVREAAAIDAAAAGRASSSLSGRYVAGGGGGAGLKGFPDGVGERF